MQLEKTRPYPSVSSASPSALNREGFPRCQLVLPLLTTIHTPNIEKEFFREPDTRAYDPGLLNGSNRVRSRLFVDSINRPPLPGFAGGIRNYNIGSQVVNERGEEAVADFISS